MKYYSFKEWKQFGYIVKKGEHAAKVDDDYKSTYLFSEEQVVPINNDEAKIMTIEQLINKINKLSKYGVCITNNDARQEDIDDIECALDDMRHIKTNWQVTSYFNEKFGEISYTSKNEDLKLALQEVYEFLIENIIK